MRRTGPGYLSPATAQRAYGVWILGIFGICVTSRGTSSAVSTEEAAKCLATFNRAPALSDTVAHYEARDVLAPLVRRAEINMVSQVHPGR
jgi:hypothetical protein